MTFHGKLACREVLLVMTDSQLIREIKDGNVELYSELMGRYQKRIMTYIFHMLKSSGLHNLTEDLCSETFFKAFRSLHTFRELDASFSTWLYTIARNTVLSELRKQKALLVSIEEINIEPIVSQESTPEEQLIINERSQMVRNAIEQLPDKQRSALVLREYEQLDYQEIATILGQSISSVKSLLFRARSSVKSHLDSYINQERQGNDLRG